MNINVNLNIFYFITIFISINLKSKSEYMPNNADSINYSEIYTKCQIKSL